MVHKTLQANYWYASKLTFELLNKDQEWNSASVIFGSRKQAKKDWLRKTEYPDTTLKCSTVNPDPVPFPRSGKNEK